MRGLDTVITSLAPTLCASNGLDYALSMGKPKILCAVGFGEHAGRALDLGIAVARAFDAQLELLHVIDDADSWWPESSTLESVVKEVRQWAAERASAVRVKLDTQRARAEEAGVTCEAFLSHGRPWRLIAETAHERDAFLIVVGAHADDAGRTIHRSGVNLRVLGSTTDRVVRAADRPVLVATGDRPIPDGLQGTRWFVGVDFSEASTNALDWTKRAVAKVDGRLYVANVVMPAGGEGKPDEERSWSQLLRDESRTEANKRLGAYCEEHAPEAEAQQVVSIDYPSGALCAAAEKVDADILVIGAHSRTLFGRLLLGSTAERTLRQANVPTLLIPHETG